MEKKTESYEDYIDNKPLIGEEPFGLTEADILKAIERVSLGVTSRIEMEKAPDKNGSRKWARKERPVFEKMLEFLTSAPPTEILAKFKLIYDRTKELQKSGIKAYKTGEIINKESPDAYHNFSEFLRGTYGPGNMGVRWTHNLEAVMQHDIVYKDLYKEGNSLPNQIRKFMQKRPH